MNELMTSAEGIESIKPGQEQSIDKFRSDFNTMLDAKSPEDINIILKKLRGILEEPKAIADQPVNLREFEKFAGERFGRKGKNASVARTLTRMLGENFTHQDLLRALRSDRLYAGYRVGKKTIKIIEDFLVSKGIN